MSKPKAVNWQLIEASSNPELYDIVNDLTEKYHPDLISSTVILMWRMNWKIDQDNYVPLATIIKSNDMYRELVPHDLILGLNFELWDFLDNNQKKAIIDDQLERVAVSRDKQDNIRIDENGRKIYRLKREQLDRDGNVLRRHNISLNDIYNYVATKFEEAFG